MAASRKHSVPPKHTKRYSCTMQVEKEIAWPWENRLTSRWGAMVEVYRISSRDRDLRKADMQAGVPAHHCDNDQVPGDGEEVEAQKDGKEQGLPLQEALKAQELELSHRRCVLGSHCLWAAENTFAKHICKA